MEETLDTTRNSPPEHDSEFGRGVLALGGILGALAASSCCVVPLVLVGLGFGGAWMVSLTALAPYSSYILAFTLACLGVGFYLEYRNPRRFCAEGAACARSTSRRITRSTLWSATALVVITTTVRYLAPLVLGVS